ncbi:hypothetical protein DB30_00860 [Enhygromyxa salina]|uniref:Dickkopf N-terminal cysteine-rich domain-containing protein n=1 Tax=Enhygromyxa salina TaxID=215803 RepID=A0A0C2CP21_9BACT|nr:hypothetical protein DB30_00860 [Enhygromyxa salina]
MRRVLALSLVFAASLTLTLACGDSGVEADELGVGAECSAAADCLDGQTCLAQFKGGYCGIEDCTFDVDCPEGSACVAHEDGSNYCFRICTNKSECNANRGPDVESNCSSNITFTDGGGGKACVPPSA